MTITTKTIVSFHIPEEYLMAMKFEAENDMAEWSKKETSQFFIYTQMKSMYGKDGDSDEAD